MYTVTVLKTHTRLDEDVLHVFLCLSGKQRSTNFEGVCCEHQYCCHLMEQCPRGHRVQTGLGTHSR